MSRYFLILPILLLTAILPRLSALTFSFSGTVWSVNTNTNLTLGDIQVDDPFFGTFSYEPTPDANPNVSQGVYNQNATLRLSIGGNEINYVNDFVYVRIGNGSTDYFDFAVDNSFDDWNMSYFGFEMEDSSGLAFADDSLPESIVLSSFDNPLFNLRGRRVSTNEQFWLDLKVTSIVSIPEPWATAPLLAAAALLYARLHRSRHKRCSTFS